MGHRAVKLSPDPLATVLFPGPYPLVLVSGTMSFRLLLKPTTLPPSLRVFQAATGQPYYILLRCQGQLPYRSPLRLGFRGFATPFFLGNVYTQENLGVRVSCADCSGGGASGHQELNQGFAHSKPVNCLSYLSGALCVVTS